MLLTVRDPSGCIDIVTRTASVEAWPNAVAPPHMRRAQARPDANRKRFMIRTSLRISLRGRNRRFVHVIATSTGLTSLPSSALPKGEATRCLAELRQFNGKMTEDFY